MSNFVPITEVRKRPSRSWRFIRRTLIIVVVCACIIILSVILINVVFNTLNPSDEQTDEIALSEQTVQTELESSNIAAPDLSSFAYIDTSNLIGPRFENITIGDTVIDSIMGQSYRETSASATYRNASIEVSTILTQRFTFDPTTNSWIGGSIKQGDPEVTPIKALSVTTIEENLDALLESYDKDIAEQFADCRALMTPSLDETGGYVLATLSKTNDNERITGTADINVSWSPTSGWILMLTSVNDIQTTPIENANEEETEITYEEGTPITLTGTIETRDEKIYLRTSNVIHLTMDEQAWDLALFELSFEDDGDSASITDGMSVNVVGTIEGINSADNAEDTDGSQSDEETVPSITVINVTSSDQ